MDINFNDWLKLDAWTTEEAACLLCGITVPDRMILETRLYKNGFMNDYPMGSFVIPESSELLMYRESYHENWKTLDKVEKLQTLLDEVTKRGVIREVSIIEGEVYYYAPKDLINWAISKGFEVPDELRDFVEVNKPQAEALGNDGVESQAATEPTSAKVNTAPKERELASWLRETWIKEGKPGGTAFFTILKKYAGRQRSPVVEHYSAGKVAGIKWETSAGTTGEMKKKTILTKVSAFKRTS